MVGGASGSNASLQFAVSCPAIERMWIFLGRPLDIFRTLAIRLDLEPSTEAVPAAPRRRARRGRAGTRTRRRAGITMGARVLIRFDFASHCQWETALRLRPGDRDGHCDVVPVDSESE